jgi:hypothetical protein
MAHVTTQAKNAAFLSAVVAWGSVCSGMQPSDESTKVVTVYERTTGTVDTVRGLPTESGVYLPMDFLTGKLHFQRKDLPGDRVGVCHGDRCIPLPKGAGANAVRSVGESEFVPLGFVSKALGATMLWDAKEGDLMLDLSRRRPEQSQGVNLPRDFSLPSLDGEPVPLSSFAGKKVLLFAWASW